MEHGVVNGRWRKMVYKVPVDANGNITSAVFERPGQNQIGIAMVRNDDGTFSNKLDGFFIDGVLHVRP